MNKIEYGICNIHYAFIEGTDTDGNPKYGEVVHVPGAVKMTVDDSSSSKSFAADNESSYITLSGASGLTAELELANFPDEFVAAAMGYRIDSLGGLVEVAGGVKKPFALGYQVEGDASGSRAWLYNTTLSRPKEEHNTVEDTIEPDTKTASLTASPIEIGGEKVTRYALPNTTASKAAYGSFFDKVTLPTASEAA